MPSLIQRVLGLAGSMVIIPIMVITMAAIRLDSPGPALFRARRVGLDGKEFTCFKLRTMRSTSTRSGPAVTALDDRRVTRIGQVLRRTRIDELPQLWNVARGEMLLVGPRPEDPRFVDLGDPVYRRVLSAKPGLTGLSQLAFVDEAAMLDSSDPERHYREVIQPQKLALDADYLRRRSTALDLWILGQTVLTAIGRRTPLAAIEARR